MEINSIPKMNMDISETSCCPKFNPEGWDGQTIVFENKPFVRMETKSFLHVPLNMGKVMGAVWKNIAEQESDPKDYYLLLSYDPSPWKGEHFMAVTKDVEGLENVKMSGTYMTKVFEGPYKDMPKWIKEMEAHVESQGKKMEKFYAFYTTCPKCLKHYGKNYVVGFAQV